MFRSRSRHSRWLKLIAAAALVGVVASACGDDGDAGSNTGDSGSSSTTTELEQPVAGGSATLLMLSDIATLDPVRFTGSGGSDGMRAFALYGALLAYDAAEQKLDPVLAESFTPSADFATWTLVLKPGVVFSDGTPMTAEAVRVNWERAKDPGSRSPSLTALRNTASLTVANDTTLVVQLVAPNAHFDKAVARTGANYIASAKAIADGVDLTSQAVGAGPFLLKQWMRDDRMVLTKNPAWKGSDGPFLDELTYRVVGDEEQRIDTFTTGQADAFYTVTPGSVTRAQDAVDGAEFAHVEATNGQVYVFNMSKPPFDDIRIRKAFVQAIDWQAMVETVSGEGAVAPDNYALDSTPWGSDESAILPYDAKAAQALIDEYVAEKGGPVVISLYAYQQALDQARADFMQASFGQMKNVKLEVQVNDSATNVGKIIAGDFSVAYWGFPMLTADPAVYLGTHSASAGNYAKMKNADIDAALDAARVTADESKQKELYQSVFANVAKEVPFHPLMVTNFGYVVSPKLGGAEVYEDGIIRVDTLWRRS